MREPGEKLLRPLRANGGMYIHMVDMDTMVSACGHAPKNDGTKMNRGKWVRLPRNRYRRYICPRCSVRLTGESMAESRNGMLFKRTLSGDDIEAVRPLRELGQWQKIADLLGWSYKQAMLFWHEVPP